MALCTATMKLGVLKGSVHVKKISRLDFRHFLEACSHMLSTSTIHSGQNQLFML